jgi:hypothetical protein
MDSITLPNGCTLRPGCRVRLPSEQVWAIPAHLVEELKLELDDNAASPGSEVVVWPKI